MHKTLVSIKKIKYEKPRIKAELLMTKLNRRGKADIDMFNLLAATCAWESY